ncbi:hypothetical protein BCR41DRAFT_425599 [Lobosporangium transversale]|uniref:FAD-binding domain-containing protein n=1 Tax=Lobosporangium transversale TaxID=64571 RepID=A0A1Y2GBS8_9FUNG|nr:hypothetical protein BCR41DRAFT_425599 [Lobosporangium transversale]ORZ05135.1 hypothetical protein BCR41DRAFT_425599 [Lobosporangium transversale]|eukprot:XP_021876910.1 hypothetical protein BCR41DRAFT_425599 [Lobosporangium transversale]
MPAANDYLKSTKKPKVLIVGAGIGGLTLGALLEKAGVPYEIYDRMVGIRPLGAALGLGNTVAPLFKQMGIWDEFLSLGKPLHSIDNYNEQRQLEFSMDFNPMKELGGTLDYVCSRAAAHSLIQRQIPAEKIHLNKRVVSIKQTEPPSDSGGSGGGGVGVQIQFADNTTAEGDILVGADGAYSNVRLNMYEQLQKQNKLPASDSAGLPYKCICLVGKTHPLDPTQFPELNDPACRFSSMIAPNKLYSWTTYTIPDNMYCWIVIQYLDGISSLDQSSFRNAEWGPEAAEAMCKDVRDFAIPGGLNNSLTMGDLIDHSPSISKVLLEEKVFDTWYSGRTVLLGDAVHKVHPAGGTGAWNAIHDAVVLANWLNLLSSSASVSEIEAVFEEYKRERYPVAKISYDNGRIFSQVVEQTLKAKVTRFVMRNVPNWLWRIILTRKIDARPQLSFLELIPDNGSVPPRHQPSLEKTLSILRAQKA